MNMCSGTFPALLSALVLAGIGTLQAGTPPDAWQPVNEAIISQHIEPGYQRLADTSGQLTASVLSYCTGQQGSIKPARADYIATQSAWQKIQHIQFGPVTTLMRNYSLQYWPDKKNTGARQLRKLLKQPEVAYDAAFFHLASVSLKGFPALEQLLFADLQPDTQACRLASAIAGHIQQMSDAIVAEWPEHAALLRQAGSNDSYESVEEASTALMKSLVEPIEAIRDNKLLRPLADNRQKSNWKRSEAWRSGQSLANIADNLSALQQLYSGTTPVSVRSLLAGQDDQLASTIERQFNQTRQQVADIPPIDHAKPSAEQDQQLRELAASLKQLHSNLLLGMQQLNIQLGFNSRDGD